MLNSSDGECPWCKNTATFVMVDNDLVAYHCQYCYASGITDRNNVKFIPTSNMRFYKESIIEQASMWLSVRQHSHDRNRSIAVKRLDALDNVMVTRQASPKRIELAKQEMENVRLFIKFLDELIDKDKKLVDWLVRSLIEGEINDEKTI